MFIISKDFIVCILNWVNLNVACIKTFISSLSSSMIKLLGLILNFSLHYSTDSDYISWDTSINLIISNFTINSFWHFSGIHVFDIIINLLESDSLKETCLRCMFLCYKESRVTLSLNTSIWLSPFSVNKVYWHFLFAIVAFKNDTFDQDLDGTNSQNSSSNTNKFVDQMTFDDAKCKLFVVVVKLWDYNFPCLYSLLEKAERV